MTFSETCYVDRLFGPFFLNSFHVTNASSKNSVATMVTSPVDNGDRHSGILNGKEMPSQFLEVWMMIWQSDLGRVQDLPDLKILAEILAEV
jgi:hypothetical protein